MLTIEKTSNPTYPRMRREMVQLRAENKRLREGLPMSRRYVKTIAIAQADAIELIDSRWNSEPTSKLYAFKTLGMSESRWYWSIALLRYAGIVSLGGQRGELRFLLTQHAEVVKALNRTSQNLSEDEAGYQKLRRLLPRSRRRTKRC